MIRYLLILFSAFAVSAQVYMQPVPTSWNFTQIGQMMTVTATFRTTNFGGYYLLISSDLKHWGTNSYMACETTNTFHSMTSECRMDLYPRSYLRVVRGGFNTNCNCCL